LATITQYALKATDQKLKRDGTITTKLGIFYSTIIVAQKTGKDIQSIMTGILH
jgi:hypothetical protein